MAGQLLALSILHKAEIFNLDKWLSRKYIIDMLYLIHFYKTGEKLKQLRRQQRLLLSERIEIKDIPAFTLPPGTAHAMDL